MRIVLSLLASLPLLASPAFGWSCAGHQMIAMIARAHLTPAASAAIDQLLRENPIDAALNRYCKERPSDLMADAATWADDERSIEKATEKWHYIDIPLAVHPGSVPKDEALQWCAALAGGSPGCIVTAIETEWAILRNVNQSAAARAEALRYVIHFLGDMAQPLHVADNHDRGGNCTSINFFAEEKPRNLHGIWDSQLLDRDLAAHKMTQPEYAKKVDESFSSHWPEWGESKTDILGWIWEGHKLAETVSYGDLKPQIPTEPATAGEADEEGCNAERNKVAALHITIGDQYFTQAMPVVREQLARAGYRLAGMLNQTFTPAAAGSSGVPSLP
jgi:hypothetical protein